MSNDSNHVDRTRKFQIRRFLGENGMQAIHGSVEFMKKDQRLYDFFANMTEGGGGESTHASEVMSGKKPFVVVTIVDPHEEKHVTLTDDAVVDLAEAINSVVYTYDEFMGEVEQEAKEK